MKNLMSFLAVSLLAISCATTQDKELAKTVHKHRLASYIQVCQQQAFNCNVVAAITGNNPDVCAASVPACANKALTEYHKALEAIGEKDASVPLSVPEVRNSDTAPREEQRLSPPL